MVYRPGGSVGAEKLPELLVSILRSKLVDSLRNMTDALGTTDPDESFTTPEMVDVSDWA